MSHLFLFRPADAVSGGSGGSGGSVRLIRELPPLRHSVEIQTPANRRFRWGADERNPANVPVGLRHSDTMPGGYENLDATLTRQPASDYPDLERLSTIRVRDAGGDVVGEYRLERTPRVSGDQMAISPSAVGWQAHLDDDKSAQMVYVDQDVNSWQEPTQARRIRKTITLGTPLNDDYSPSVGQGSVSFNGPSGKAIPISSSGEVMYTMPAGVKVARLTYRGVEANTTNITAAALGTSDNADLTGATSTALTLDDVLRSTVGLTATRYAQLSSNASATHTPAAGAEHHRLFKVLAVYGNHALTTRTSSTGPDGVYASDVVLHAVGRWAPLLVANNDTVVQSDFVIEHLVFADPTTAAEIVRQATRFGLEDWAVWAGRTFYWNARGLRGRNWRARVGPSGLEETGPQIDRVWESIIVQYQDVSGGQKTVGPPGSGADTESAYLKDTDPDNPANQLGITRRDLLSMGVGTAASATEVGRRFLEQTKLLDTSGRAMIAGHIENDRGVLFPFSSMRAGDTLTFLDAADTSPRRIVRTDKDHAARTCSVDLDAPPEGLAALLERLNVVLVPLGL